MIDLDGEEFKIDACVSIQFNILQKILIKMNQNDKDLQDKIYDLEKKLNKYDEKFNSIENNILNLSKNNAASTTIIEKYIEKEPTKEYDSNEIKTPSLDIKENENDETLKQSNGKKESKRSDKREMSIKEENEEYEEEDEKDEKDEKNDKKEKDEKDQIKEKINKNKIIQFTKKKNSSGKDLLELKDNDDSSHYRTDTISEVNKSDTQDIEIERIINSLPNNFGLENQEKLNDDSADKYKLKTFPELLTLFNKRIHQCEKNIKELYRISKIHNMLNNGINKNKEVIEEHNKEIDNLKKNINDLEIKSKQFKNEMEQMRVKVEDFNIYDLLKDGGDGNLDAAKVLIMSLEKKVFKKFEQNDEKQKNLDEEMFKHKNDVKQINEYIDNLKRKFENENLNDDILNQFNEFKDEINERLKNININTNIENDSSPKENEEKRSEIDEEKLNNLINNSINDSEGKIMTNIKKIIEETKNNIMTNHETSINENLNIIKNLSKKLKELEKSLEQKVNEDIFTKMSEKISKMEEDLKQKTNKFNFEELSDKVGILEEKFKDTDYKMEQINEAEEKIRFENSNIVRKIEYLSGEYAKLAFGPVNDSNVKKRNSIYDLTRYVESSQFLETTKKLFLKIDNLRTKIESNQKNIEDILERLKGTPTEDDFDQYQNLLKAMLEDLKLSCNKKYADKIDVQKTFRYIETQIKSLNENYKREGETWLLAKKPLSNYLCASCESVIRDMNTKSDYIPWGKYPKRDEERTKYRMGHGFSRMLQMVNTDLLRTQESKEKEKIYASDDEHYINDSNKINNNDKKVKLPYVNKRGNNNSNINNSVNIDNNNSSLIGGKNMSINSNTNKSVVLNSKGNEVNQGNMNDNVNGQPKLMKIVKFNRNNNQININSGNDNYDQIHSTTDPNLP